MNRCISSPPKPPSFEILKQARPRRNPPAPQSRALFTQAGPVAEVGHVVRKRGCKVCRLPSRIVEETRQGYHSVPDFAGEGGSCVVRQTRDSSSRQGGVKPSSDMSGPCSSLIRRPNFADRRIRVPVRRKKFPVPPSREFSHGARRIVGVLWSNGLRILGQTAKFPVFSLRNRELGRLETGSLETGPSASYKPLFSVGADRMRVLSPSGIASRTIFAGVIAASVEPERLALLRPGEWQILGARTILLLQSVEERPCRL